MKEDVKAFLNELSKLTQKYGIEIYRCGCCPALFYKEIQGKEQIISEGIRYKNGAYEIDK